MKISTFDEAVSLFEKKYSEYLVEYCVDYDSKRFVLLPIEKSGPIDMYKMHYAIFKDDGHVEQFNVFDNIKAFEDARKNRSIDYYVDGD